MSAAADVETLALCERFHSIQGESTRAGLPCLFRHLNRPFFSFARK